MKWEMKKLGDVCKIVNGGTPDTTVKEYWDGDNLWITPKDMGKINSMYVDDTERKITDAGVKNSSAKLLPIHSVVLSSRAPIGYLAINTKPMTTNQGCKGIIPSKKINAIFLFYFLKNSVDLLNELGTGTTFKELSSSKLSLIEIPVPQLIEQQRIVSILDESFAALDQAKDNLQRNVQNAKDLFQSELNEIFTRKGDDWVEKKLEKVLQKTETINPLNQPNKEYIYIDVSSVNKELLLIEETSLIKGENAPSRARKLVKTNDVIFATVRPTLKRIAIITESYNGQICSTGYFVLRASPIIHYGLLFYYLQTIDFQENMKVLQKGASYPAVTDGQIRDQIIAFPKDKKEQQRIVERLDALCAETQTLTKIYEQKLLYIESLKKSLLQKAFSGGL